MKQFYKGLAEKFYDTSRAVSELDDLVGNGIYSTYQASTKAKDVAIKASDLCDFAKAMQLKIMLHLKKLTMIQILQEA